MATVSIVFESLLVQAGQARLREEEEQRQERQTTMSKEPLTESERLASSVLTTRSKKREVVVPYLFALRQVMPVGTDLVLRSLQLLHDGRLAINIGTKIEAAAFLPPNSSNGPSQLGVTGSGVAGFNATNSKSQTVVALKPANSASTTPSTTVLETSTVGPWLDENTGLPATSYFAVSSEWKGRAPYVCLVPSLVRADSATPLQR